MNLIRSRISSSSDPSWAYVFTYTGLYYCCRSRGSSGSWTFQQGCVNQRILTCIWRLLSDDSIFWPWLHPRSKHFPSCSSRKHSAMAALNFWKTIMLRKFYREIEIRERQLHACRELISFSTEPSIAFCSWKDPDHRSLDIPGCQFSDILDNLASLWRIGRYKLMWKSRDFKSWSPEK